MSHPSEHVQVPELSEAALDAQWSGVRRRRSAHAKQRRAAAVAVAAMLAIGIVTGGAWWVGHRRGAEVGHAAPAIAVATTETPPNQAPFVPSPPTSPGPRVLEMETAEVALADGAVFRAAPGARVETCDGGAASTCLRVRAGTVTFEPAPDAPELAVRAGPVEVRSTAARFVIRRTVAGSVHHVNLQVEVGEVEVFRGPDHSVQLSAGESVSFETEREAEATVPPSAPTVDAAKASPASNDDEPDRGDPAAPGQGLWDRAKHARRAGRHADAASLYAELVRDHGKDPNAGLAALELARLRMDTLNDVAGAIDPLERALEDRRGSIREDALARLVRAYDELGRSEGCERRRRQYLERHPKGVHTAVVERACGHG